MRKIKIFDTTLRDGEQAPWFGMSKSSKVEIAKMLDEMGVDVIEAGFAASNGIDFEAIKAISNEVKLATVCSLARLNKNDIDKAYETIMDARHKRIHVFIATSDIHIKDKLHMTRDEVINCVHNMVRYAKSKVDDIEFSLEDATRSDKDFACKVIDTAIEAGATTINIPDTVGYTEPDEFREFLTYLKENSRLDEVDWSVHCHNDLGLAVANTMTAIKCGASQVEGTINGIGERAGNVDLIQVLANISVRNNIYDVYTDVALAYSKKISQLVEDVTHQSIPKNYPVVGDNAFEEGAGIHQGGVAANEDTYHIMDNYSFGVPKRSFFLGNHTGHSAVAETIRELGKDPSKYDVKYITMLIKSDCELRMEENNDNSPISPDSFYRIISNHKIKTFNK